MYPFGLGRRVGGKGEMEMEMEDIPSEINFPPSTLHTPARPEGRIPIKPRSPRRMLARQRTDSR